MLRGCAVVAYLILHTAGLLAPVHAAERVALVIGNSAYRHAAPLKNPRNDANAVSAELAKLGFKVIKGVDLDRLALEASVRKFAVALRGAKVGMFYYAGHGLQVEGRNYLAPVDAAIEDETDLDFQMVAVDTVLRTMERERRTNLVFLDACRNNPLARNLARSMGTRSSAVGQGLARIETGVGTLIAFATQPGNVALDGEGANSPFTTALVKHMETPDLDVALMMRRVREDVMAATNERQVPWSNSSLTGSFAFRTGGGASAVSYAAPKPAAAPSMSTAAAPSMSTATAFDLEVVMNDKMNVGEVWDFGLFGTEKPDIVACTRPTSGGEAQCFVQDQGRDGPARVVSRTELDQISDAGVCDNERYCRIRNITSQSVPFTLELWDLDHDSHDLAAVYQCASLAQCTLQTDYGVNRYTVRAAQ